MHFPLSVKCQLRVLISLLKFKQAVAVWNQNVRRGPRCAKATLAGFYHAHRGLLGPLAHHFRNRQAGHQASRPTQHSTPANTAQAFSARRSCLAVACVRLTGAPTGRPAGQPGKQNRSVPSCRHRRRARSSVSCVGHACFRRSPHPEGVFRYPKTP